MILKLLHHNNLMRTNNMSIHQFPHVHSIIRFFPIFNIYIQKYISGNSDS